MTVTNPSCVLLIAWKFFSLFPAEPKLLIQKVCQSQKQAGREETEYSKRREQVRMHSNAYVYVLERLFLTL